MLKVIMLIAQHEKNDKIYMIYKIFYWDILAQNLKLKGKLLLRAYCTAQYPDSVPYKFWYIVGI